MGRGMGAVLAHAVTVPGDREEEKAGLLGSCRGGCWVPGPRGGRGGDWQATSGSSSVTEHAVCPKRLAAQHVPVVGRGSAESLDRTPETTVTPC